MLCNLIKNHLIYISYLSKKMNKILYIILFKQIIYKIYINK